MSKDDPQNPTGPNGWADILLPAETVEWQGGRGMSRKIGSERIPEARKIYSMRFALPDARLRPSQAHEATKVVNG